MGFCTGYGTPGFVHTGGGFGRGPGGGFGRGFGHGFHRGYGRGYGVFSAPQWTAKSEKEFLNNEIGGLKEQLKAMETRLSELKDG
jgi:hypothetical protein